MGAHRPRHGSSNVFKGPVSSLLDLAPIFSDDLAGRPASASLAIRKAEPEPSGRGPRNVAEILAFFRLQRTQSSPSNMAGSSGRFCVTFDHAHG